MKTTIRDAVVNCRPTKMQKNSAAKSAPATRPPTSVPSCSKSAMRRALAQSQSRMVAPPDRNAACQSAPISGSAAFAATWLRPHRKQQTIRLATAIASRWLLRSRIAAMLGGVVGACRPPPARASIADSRSEQAGDQPARMRERRSGDVPSGRLAQGGAERSLARDLERDAGEHQDGEPA